MKTLVCLAATAAVCLASAQHVPFTGGPALDEQIQNAIKDGRLPGAVLLVGHDGRVVYKKAYGNRSVEPTTEAMTAEDAAVDPAIFQRGKRDGSSAAR